ncbi:DNRLRE domain-containing protein [Micromonospora sp. WMMD1082]|uniref:DNRLRE domain-containing protein n=1 Tax=Micromonospora sp. WMMD1082 TaxID=3016104 RepID=UPI002417A7A8|nr:DNRLRE domain-containing protein [Micromonospora sp. WMMD1082]MDG4797820.1 DNRLRE domain-containing protein [Micromonospora sp. WMMD1082]
MTATVRSCLAAGVAVLTVAALAGLPGEPAAFLAAGPDGVTGGVQSRTDEAISSRAARESGAPVQVKSLTSETTEVFALPDGQFRAEIASGVQRFRRDGEWIPVDLTLGVQPDGSVAPAAHPNDLRITGAKGLGEHELAAVGHGADRVAMGWSGQLPAPVLTANRATYPDARPGVDLVVEATRLGFEQFLIVKDRAALAQVEKIHFPFSGPGAATAAQGTDGSITLTNRAGAQTARIPAPLMWDARRNIAGSPANQEPVRTDVARRGDRVELTLTPDPAWLRSKSTVFPVTIDPTVNPLGTTFDTYVRETVTTDQNQQPDLQIGLLATTPATLTRSFITWDTTVLAGKQITAATVSFWNFWSHTCTPTSWEIWSTGTSTYTTTFANQPSWDFREATSTATHGSTDCADAWATIDGRNFFQRAATANKTRAGMGIRATDETVPAGFKQFRSREGASSTENPKASVTYNSWPTVTTRATVPATTCATGSGRPQVNTLTPQLRATVSDGDGTAMTVTFEWWAMNAEKPIGTAVFSGVASGATAATTVPAGAFVDGGIYRWRVKAADGVAGSDVWSSFCEMQVYTTATPVTGCAGGTESDFNGDGVADIAIADPEATVSGAIRAGRITVAYGGGTTVHTLHEGAARVPGAPEAGDRFGTAVSAYDANNDGCTDLAVGVPNQSVSGQAQAGAVYVLLGSPAGLAQGPDSLVYHQDVTNVPDSAEAYDWFGHAVAGSRTASGEPYLVIGVPGEGLTNAALTGVVHYLRGTVNVVLSQGGGGITGAAEIDDRTGFAVAASTHHWAVGSPGEAIGTEAFAGAVNVFNHTLTNGLPTLAATLDQNVANVSNVAEADDNFGKSIAIAPFRPVGAPAGQADSLVVVGVPGEDITVAATNTPAPDAGLVHRFHVTAANTFTELPAITFASEDGDYLGEKVVVVNTAPASEGTNSTMFIAIGVPGEDAGTTTADSGRVRIFPALANPIGTPITLERRSGAMPGSAIGQELVGTSLAATAQRLHVGTPYGTDAVYGFRWTDLVAGNTAPSSTWQPGQGGLPTGHSAFGAAIG